MAAGKLSAQVRRNPAGRVEEGAGPLPWEGLEGVGTYRSLEQAGGDCLVHRSTSMLGLRKGICQGHLGGASTSSQGKLLPVIVKGLLG